MSSNAFVAARFLLAKRVCIFQLHQDVEIKQLSFKLAWLDRESDEAFWRPAILWLFKPYWFQFLCSAYGLLFCYGTGSVAYRLQYDTVRLDLDEDQVAKGGTLMCGTHEITDLEEDLQ